MFIIGIDLSGPANIADTAVATFAVNHSGLQLHNALTGASDRAIYSLIQACAQTMEVTVGLDAPLSYNPGGGDRERDRQLRQRVVSAGMHSGSVMTPTMTRMAYLTLRGISLGHMLRAIEPTRVHVVEIHPGATLALRGAPIDHIRRLKTSQLARNELLIWLESLGVTGLAGLQGSGDHLVAACAGALAAWQWRCGISAWQFQAEPPFHPFAFAC